MNTNDYKIKVTKIKIQIKELEIQQQKLEMKSMGNKQTRLMKLKARLTKEIESEIVNGKPVKVWNFLERNS